jgi:6-phosphogluconolactonase
MTELQADAAPRLEPFADREALTAAAAELVTAQIRAGLAAREEAGVALSGGSTPEPLYRRLAGAALPWDQVVITLADERWVDAEHADSNERMIRATLLSGAAAEARFVPLKDGRTSPETAAESASVALTAAPWPLDAVVLGMGEDAHFASLFPGNPSLPAGLDPAAPLCLPVPAGSPAPAQPRLSLSLAAILDSRLILVLIQGEAKRAAFERARAGHDPLEAPIRAVLHQSQTPVRVLWAP